MIILTELKFLVYSSTLSSRGLISDHFNSLVSSMSRRLYVLRVLKSVFGHDQLVIVYKSLIISLMDYASPVFLNPGSTLDSRLYALCKRAFRIVHGVGIRSCSNCDMFDFRFRRAHSSQNLFMTSLRNPAHILHPLLPHTLHRRNRLLLPCISS